MVALKSWYRNKDGEQLPFDNGRGGKHYLHVRIKKASIEHIPNKKEMFQIIDMTSSLRDKAILLFLFQSGVRVNVLQHITYKNVKRRSKRHHGIPLIIHSWPTIGIAALQQQKLNKLSTTEAKQNEE